MKKILLFILYPVAFIFNKDLRKYQKNKIKYWAADNDYFKSELNGLKDLLIKSAILYFLFFYGIALIYKATLLGIYGVGNSISKVNQEINAKYNIDATEQKSFLNANTIVEKEKVEITELEYQSNLNDVDVKKDIQNTEDEITSFLKNQREKNK